MLDPQLMRTIFLGELSLSVLLLRKTWRSWNKHVDLITSKAQKMLNLPYCACKEITDIRTKNYFTQLGFDRAFKNTLACYGLKEILLA